MTSGPEIPSPLPALATLQCPYCGVVVPDAGFCGACGAHLAGSAGHAAQRMHSYAAFPDEPVLRFSAVTALFPHLSHHARAPFRAGLGIFLALLAAFALAGTTAPLMALSALGVPLLFGLYVWEVDPYEGTFFLPTGTALVAGAGLGAGWAILGAGYVEKALEPSAFFSLTSASSIVSAVVVPGAGQLLMFVPLVAVRALERGTGEPLESLDGFVAGATGALGFSLAATIYLMAPWLTGGQFTHQGFLGNITQVFLRGVAFPLTSAMTTGLAGASWWVSTRARTTSARGRRLTSLPVALLVAFSVQVGLGFADLAALGDPVVIAVHLGALGLLILVVRIGIHHVLLHEAVAVRVGPPRACAHCAHLVPAMAFCPQCGVAERATARPHRSATLLA